MEAKVIKTPTGNFEKGFYSFNYDAINKITTYSFLGAVLYNFPCDELKVHLSEQPLNSIIEKFKLSV